MPALIDEPWHVEVWGMVRQPDGTDRTTRADIVTHRTCPIWRDGPAEYVARVESRLTEKRADEFRGIATLIAAAPDMKEALILLADAAELFRDGELTVAGLEDAIGAARAALTKSENV